MPKELVTARLILVIVAASYVLSAVLLTVMRSRGTVVPGWVIGTWAVTGVAGIALAMALAPGRAGVWIALPIVLVPWMVYSLVGDIRLGHYVIAATDVAAIAAIAFALTISRPAVW